jgi:hypothetical protein
MKLAEALIRRADTQKYIAQLKGRLLLNATTQKGEPPAESPELLLAELGRAAQSLLDLIRKINRTNAAINIEGKTLYGTAVHFE